MVKFVPIASYALTAFSVISFAADPVGGVAEELGISKQTAAELLKGNVTIMLNPTVLPNRSATVVQLYDGSMLHLKDTVQFVTRDENWIATKVEEGEIIEIKTTEVPGVYSTLVRRNNEAVPVEVGIIKPGRAVEGQPLPPGWRIYP